MDGSVSNGWKCVRWLLSAATVAAVVAAAFYVGGLDVSKYEKSERHNKTFRREIASDARVSRYGLYGIDLISFKSAHVEKMKRGFLTLGGLNVLVIDGLSVVLPENGTDTLRQPRTAQPGPQPASARDSGRRAAADFLSRLGISESAFGVGRQLPKVSGLVVNGVTLSRLDAATNVVPVLVATRGELESDGLKLRDCRLTGFTPARYVGEACLTVNPHPCVVWQGGKIDL